MAVLNFMGASPGGNQWSAVANGVSTTDNVGIGGDPTATTPLNVEDGAGGVLLQVTAAGNVGIAGAPDADTPLKIEDGAGGDVFEVDNVGVVTTIGEYSGPLVRTDRLVTVSGVGIAVEDDGNPILFIDKDQFLMSSDTYSAGYTRKFFEGETGAMAGASATITLSIPDGAIIRGVALKVKTLVASPYGGANNMDIAFSGGSTTAIVVGAAFAKNTSIIKGFAGDPVSGAVANIAITPDAGTFSAGEVAAVVIADVISNMPDFA